MDEAKGGTQWPEQEQMMYCDIQIGKEKGRPAGDHFSLAQDFTCKQLTVSWGRGGKKCNNNF